MTEKKDLKKVRNIIYFNIYIGTIYLKLREDDVGNTVHNIYANHKPQPNLKI